MRYRLEYSDAGVHVIKRLRAAVRTRHIFFEWIDRCEQSLCCLPSRHSVSDNIGQRMAHGLPRLPTWILQRTSQCKLSGMFTWRVCKQIGIGSLSAVQRRILVCLRGDCLHSLRAWILG